MKPPAAAPMPTAEQLHARRCFLLGITDPAKVDRLWTAERARIEAGRKVKPKARKR